MNSWRRFLSGSMVIAATLAVGPQPSAAVEEAGQVAIDPSLTQILAMRGEASYLVLLRARADLSDARAMTDRDARGQAVFQALKDVALRSQGPLLTYLDEEVRAGRAKEVRAFFSINAIGVTSTESTLQGVARFAQVERIVRVPVVEVPRPFAGVEQATVNGVEWNVDRIRAPEVWDKGVLGQGIIVANIDSGVQFDHPALVNQYRGHTGGAFDHNYNWWDPSQVCGSPSTVPCDNNGHGTHTMGTMVGDDGGTNRIGVAPQAQWIACKGCEGQFCSPFALLECGDFILAPWDLNKGNPDPSKRPHVVNNSWGGLGGIPWYQGVVQAWRAAGIFPAFSVGNLGPSCSSAGSPGDYPESFAAGATDMTDDIASFSGRGPSVFGVTKPDVVAPGVNVRSSIPRDAYASFSGTSMASPHVAGTVALLWATYPGLSRDVPSTEQKLRPAGNVLNTDQGCGADGTTSHPNNVFGWGLDDARQAWEPVNVYTDRSVYTTGDTMDVFLSFVNPVNQEGAVDLYVGVVPPGGPVLYLPAFGETPTPFASDVTVPALVEVFDVPTFTHTFGSDPVGTYVWFAGMTPPGTDPADGANVLTVDTSTFEKQ